MSTASRFLKNLKPNRLNNTSLLIKTANEDPSARMNPWLDYRLLLSFTKSLDKDFSLKTFIMYNFVALITHILKSIVIDLPLALIKLAILTLGSPVLLPLGGSKNFASAFGLNMVSLVNAILTPITTLIAIALIDTINMPVRLFNTIKHAIFPRSNNNAIDNAFVPQHNTGLQEGLSLQTIYRSANQQLPLTTQHKEHPTYVEELETATSFRK